MPFGTVGSMRSLDNSLQQQWLNLLPTEYIFYKQKFFLRVCTLQSATTVKMAPEGKANNLPWKMLAREGPLTAVGSGGRLDEWILEMRQVC